MADAAYGPARARLFRLFEAVIADGLGPGLRDAMAAFPEFEPTLAEARSADEDAAEHQDLFGFRIPPFAGLWLDDGLRVGGPAADEALAAYVRADFRRIRDDLGADHLATELAFLAHCAERGLHGDARAFLDGHVLGWLPGLVAAVDREPYAAYRDLARLMLDAVVDFRAALGGSVATAPGDAETPDVLERPGTGVREIAEHLCMPVRSGIFVGRGDIARLARAAGSPRGFGGRVLMLGNLLRSAASYDRLDDVLQGLDGIARETGGWWETAAESGAGSLPSWSALWSARTRATRSLLVRVGERLREAADDQSGSGDGASGEAADDPSGSEDRDA